MLGYIISEHPGQSDALLRQVAQTLLDDGVRLIGAVQTTHHQPQDDRHAMTLRLLPEGPDIPISQNLGKGSSGCTLDPDGLELAAGLIAAGLDSAPHLLLLNKFGKQEAEGHGFRAAIGAAISQGIPVLIGVGREKLASFQGFAQGMAEELPKDAPALAAWCHANMEPPQAV